MKKRNNFLQVLFSHTHLLFITPIFIHFLAHISQNGCTTTITAASHPPPQAETSVVLHPEAFPPQKICSYFSSLMHSCPSFCSEEHFRTLSSLHVTISSCRRWGRNYLKSCDTRGKHLPDFWMGLRRSLPCNNLQSWFQQLLTVLWRFDLWPNFNFPTEYN